MLMDRVYPGTGCATELTIVSMEVMRPLIVDLNVVSILIFSVHVSTFREVLQWGRIFFYESR